MSRKLALAFIAWGVALMVFGYDVYIGTGYDLSRMATEAPPDGAVWLVITGLLAAITGAFGLTGEPQKNQ